MATTKQFHRDMVLNVADKISGNTFDVEKTKFSDITQLAVDFLIDNDMLEVRHINAYNCEYPFVHRIYKYVKGHGGKGVLLSDIHAATGFPKCEIIRSVNKLAEIDYVKFCGRTVSWINEDEFNAFGCVEDFVCNDEGCNCTTSHIDHSIPPKAPPSTDEDEPPISFCLKVPPVSLADSPVPSPKKQRTGDSKKNKLDMIYSFKGQSEMTKDERCILEHVIELHDSHKSIGASRDGVNIDDLMQVILWGVHRIGACLDSLRENGRIYMIGTHYYPQYSDYSF